MMDFGDLATLPNTQVFYANFNDEITGMWRHQYAWHKPRSAIMVQILAIGAGGSGGGGVSGGGTTGGGGGGSGGIASWSGPACLLPDVLYVRVPRGMPGGGAGLNGSQVPDPVAVSIAPVVASAAAQSISIIYPNTTGLNGGGGQSATTGGTAGAALTALSTPFLGLGLWTSIAGQAGTNGASASNGNATNLAFGNLGIPISGGTGGGNGTGNGGALTGAGLVPTIAASTVDGQAGSTGFQCGKPINTMGPTRFPFIHTGATGGAGHTTGTGGAGGFGAYGSGGGGGGGTNNAAGTGGAGGRGGDGLVIISWW